MHPKLNQIASYATKALLYEVSASPKPGLVDRLGTGAHSDMDYFTFIDSALSLYDTFYACAEVGSQFEGNDPKMLLSLLRPVGMTGEKKMLEATRGVNTHKGAIFSLGILCAVAGKHDLGQCHARQLCAYVKRMAEGLTNELKDRNSEKPLTAGEKLYKQHGTLGIRGEVEAGFPSVLTYGLPLLEAMVSEGKLDRNAMMIQTLMTLLCHVDDSNVLARKGLEGLELVRTKAATALKLGGAYTDDGRQFIHQMDQDFIEVNISPGGTADLLAVTLMLHFLEHDGELC